MKNPKFKSDVFDFAKSIRKVSSTGLEELIFRLSAYTGLPPEVCDDLLSIFLDEILNFILEGNKMKFPFGKLFLAKRKNKYTLILTKFNPVNYVFKNRRNK